MYYEIMKDNNKIWRYCNQDNYVFEYQNIKDAIKDFNRYIRQFSKYNTEKPDLQIIEIDGENKRVIKELTEQQFQEAHKKRKETSDNIKAAQKKIHDAINRHREKHRYEARERAEAKAQKKYEEKITDQAIKNSNGQNPYSQNIEKVKKQGKNESHIISGAEQGWSI